MTDNQRLELKREEQFQAARERLSILRHYEDWFEIPMACLSVVWLSLMVIELVWGLGRFGQRLTTGIWIIFFIDFLIRFAMAPRKLRYMRRNWLTVISLLLPALRVARIGRVFRAISRLRGLQLVRILGSVNRGMKALGMTMRRRGAGYIAALTAIVTLAGAAGMLFFEKAAPGGSGLNDFWTALWWTAMLITTMGSEYWPQTPEGRALCLLLSIYAFTVFGYVTGAIATYFIGRDAADDRSEMAGAKDLQALRAEIAALREELKSQRGG